MRKPTQPMPVLDRFVDVLFQKQAAALIFADGQRGMIELDGAQRPVTKEVLEHAKVMALIKEVAPEPMQEQLEAGDGRVVFSYSTNGKLVDIEANRSGTSLTAAIRPAQARQSMAAVSVPAEALRMSGEPFTRVSRPKSGSADMLGQAEERIQELLRQMVSSDSSDLHLRVGMPPLFRTHGELHSVDEEEPLTMSAVESLVQSIMPERNRQEFAETSDTDFAYEIVELARFRVNALRDRHGVGAVFRVIPNEIKTVEELGVSEEVQKLCYLTKGLVLVTGPTGSGKSTTLAALIDLINRNRTDHIITIEDPIEFVHPNKRCLITQRQVGTHTESFKRALRGALREDPDVVLIGEMRDLETAAIAIETAETGHLVFGTLHTTTAVSTVDRIIDQFPADRQSQIRVMLSESLKGVIAQVLCKKIGGGRVAAHEILLATTSVSNLIREGKSFQLPSVMQTNRKLGMVTLNDSLLDLVDRKVVEVEEAYMKAADKEGMGAALKSRGLRIDLGEL